MYLEFFRLKEFPFNITPDPRYLYLSRQHREAYHHVMYGIAQRKGFILLTGEVGSGKTTLCRAVLANVGSKTKTALILNPCLNDTQLLRAILGDFGLPSRGLDRLGYIERLNKFLLERAEAGDNVALLIDEAQNLSPALMEQVRLLSNLETDTQKLLQIVLIGQPELEERVASPALRQLRQRITIRYHLRALSEAETAAYIVHRLKMAGAEDGAVTFDPKAIRLAHRYAQGIPRLINAVCDSALLAAYVANSPVVDAACMKRAIAHLEGRDREG
jgi:general secretion pathway protein A